MKLTSITNKFAICLLIGFKNSQLNANWVGDIVSGTFGAIGSGITIVGAGLDYGLGVLDPVFNVIDYAMGGFAFPDETGGNINPIDVDGADFGAPPDEYFPDMRQSPQGFPGGQQGPPSGSFGGPQGFPPSMQGPPPGFPGGPQGFPQRIPPGGQHGQMMRSKKPSNLSESEEIPESIDTSKAEIHSEIKHESTEKPEPVADSTENLGQE
jgi:hypothetical protein